MTADRVTADDRYPTGLIVGRFDPPHLGHSFMIEWAQQRCDRLVVFVNCSAERDAAPGDRRSGWLRDLHADDDGSVTVLEVRHALTTDFDDEDLWRRWIDLFRSKWPHDEGPHVVFSSDEYVVELARRLGADHVVVDADRSTVPISATQVRADPAAHLDRLAPAVRAWVEANWL